MTSLEGVRAFYPTGQELALGPLPAGTWRVVARRARGDVVDGDVVETDLGRGALFPGLAPGTYSIEAIDHDASVLAEELTTVAEHAGERPVHGFATSFCHDDVPAVLEWLRALRCTVVQVYDWMASYAAPLGPPQGWKDPSNRPVSYDALRSLAAGIRAGGAVAHAYAPVYAVDLPFAAAHPELLMVRNDGRPQRFFDMIELADPANVGWQRHFAATYGAAADSIGFDGFHVDTYGYPRAAYDPHGEAIDMRAAYESFLAFFRAARPRDQISFNQVNGVPSAVRLPPGPGFRYCEVWPPNDEWRHLEGLMDRSSGRAGLLEAPEARDALVRGSIACYPPVWRRDDPAGPVGGPAREASLRTALCTEAVATCLGASALLYGDVRAVLCDPYYPKHERLSAGEAATVLAWHRFALRCRDLFLEGEDTSWYDIADENGAVAVNWDGPVRPEPVGGALFARVVRSEDCVAVGVLDLTGSAHGSWSEPTAPGRCRSVRARLLLQAPEHWDAAVATLGRAGDRFVPVPVTEAEHREGRAVEVEVPLEAGWSVLRMTRS
ncbi:MAG: glycoside hydrolase family 66 protein [Acidimicrobiales bacterium]